MGFFSTIRKIISDVSETAKHKTKIPLFALKEVRDFAEKYNIEELEFNGCDSWESYDDKLMKIKYLYIENKNITEIPIHVSTFLEKSDVEILSFKGNLIKEIGMQFQFENCRNLKILDFSHNKISEVSEYFNAPYGLHKIDLSHNYISKLPNNFMGKDNFYSVETLDLSFNKISELPFDIRFHVNLKTLNLSNNNFIRECCFKYDLPTDLEFLDLSNNQITKLSIPYTKLKILKVDNNNIESKFDYDLKVVFKHSESSFINNPICDEENPYEEETVAFGTYKQYLNHCWRCGNGIDSKKNEKCYSCGLYICDSCGACFCSK